MLLYGLVLSYVRLSSYLKCTFYCSLALVYYFWTLWKHTALPEQVFLSVIEVKQVPSYLDHVKWPVP